MALSTYDRLGGGDGVRRLAARFYQLMDTLPEAAACRAVHPPSLTHAQAMLVSYLDYWFGGPDDFIRHHGPPAMRRRHLHVAIGEAEIRGWLVCFHQAWAETVADRTLDAEVLPRVEQLAWHMANQPGVQAPDLPHTTPPAVAVVPVSAIRVA